MARRKSLLAQMYAARQKAKLDRQRTEDQAQRAWEAEEAFNAGGADAFVDLIQRAFG